MAATSFTDLSRVHNEAKQPINMVNLEVSANPTNVSIPAYSAWYEPGKVHEIEKRSLPEFFNSQSFPSSKSQTSFVENSNEKNIDESVSNSMVQSFNTVQSTPVVEQSTGKNRNLEKVYIEARDFMVQTYRMRPQDYLTLTMCRRHLTGDVGSLVRIHSFLEQWGLINKDCPAEITRARRPVILPSAPLFSASETSAIPAVSRAAAVATRSTNALDRYLSTIKSVPPTPAEAHIRPDLNSTFEWDESKTLHLLEVIENCTIDTVVDWDSVSLKVGTSKEDCIMRFLQLPTLEILNDEKLISLVEKIEPEAIPFHGLSNPVMSTLAFLASVVHPRVAASAAQAALASHPILDSEAKIFEKTESESDKVDRSLFNNENISGDKDNSLQKIAATSLACAAVRAAELSQEESRRAALLRDTLVDLHLQKLRLKVSMFEELEKSLEEDKRELEQQRLALFFDRFNLRKQMMAVEEKIAGHAISAETKSEDDDDETATDDPNNNTTMDFDEPVNSLESSS